MPAPCEFTQIANHYDNVIFYCVDPGATRLFTLLAQRIHRKIFIFCDGWAAQNKPPFARHVRQLRSFIRQCSTKTLLVLGSQSDFNQTQKWIDWCQKLPCDSAFVFDHWKNYCEHFYNQRVYLPNYIFVPDNHAKAGLIHAFAKQHAQYLAMVKAKLRICPQYSILQFSQDILAKTTENQQKYIAILLDPEAENTQLYPGYTPLSVLRYLHDYITEHHPKAFIKIKPHPRQQHEKILPYLQTDWDRIQFEYNPNFDLADLIAQAQEVWGMTSVSLIMARLANKPIKSFQIKRNKIGLSQSNAFIEPTVII